MKIVNLFKARHSKLTITITIISIYQYFSLTTLSLGSNKIKTFDINHFNKCFPFRRLRSYKPFLVAMTLGHVVVYHRYKQLRAFVHDSDRVLRNRNTVNDISRLDLEIIMKKLFQSE